MLLIGFMGISFEEVWSLLRRLAQLDTASVKTAKAATSCDECRHGSIQRHICMRGSQLELLLNNLEPISNSLTGLNVGKVGVVVWRVKAWAGSLLSWSLTNHGANITNSFRDSAPFLCAWLQTKTQEKPWSPEKRFYTCRQGMVLCAHSLQRQLRKLREGREGWVGVGNWPTMRPPFFVSKFFCTAKNWIFRKFKGPHFKNNFPVLLKVIN